MTTPISTSNPTNASVSVAMAAYQGARFIRQQLHSIAAGTVLPDELVICDDGSTDETVEIIERFAASAPFPTRLVRHEENLGTLRAFGTAIANCTGSIIVLCDQDDIWHPDRIEALLHTFAESPSAQLVFSDADLIGPRGESLGTFWPMVGVTKRHLHLLAHEPFGLLVARPMVGGCTMAMRAEHAAVLLPMPTFEVGEFGPLVHDRWLSMALAAFGPFGLVQRPLLSYRLHSEQQIGVPSRRLRRVIPPHLRQWRQVFVPRSVQRQRLEVDRLYLVELERRVQAAGITLPNWAAIPEAVDHLEVRVNLPAGRWRRARHVIAEWRTGRYSRFALGSASAIGDLVRR
jgi:glycosyltransferase involved in cell wall biosynthesis